MHKRDYSPQGVEGSLMAKLEGRVLEAHSPSKTIFEDGASISIKIIQIPPC